MKKMSKYRLLFGLLAKDFYKGTSSGKKKFVGIIVTGLSTLPLLIVICVMLYTLTKSAVGRGIFPQEVTLVVGSAQVITFFFAIHGILSTLYLSEDSQFLASLPVSPTTIFFAKISLVYLNELIISAYVLLPSLLTVALTASSAGYIVFPAFYALIPIIILLTPMLPLAIASVVSMPLMYLSRFFKRRSVVGTVVILILFGALFALYFLIVPEILDTSSVVNLSDGAVSAIVKISNVAYPDKVVIYTALGINPWVNLGISVGIYTGMISFIILISKLFYQKAVSAQAETTKSTITRHREQKRQSHVLALLERDFKSLVRYPGLALSSFMNVILSPIMLIVTYAFTDADTFTVLLSAEDSDTIIVQMVITGVAFLYSILLNTGINSTASLAFSRDGKAYYEMKHLPIKPSEIIAEKVIFANIVSAVGIVVLTVIVGAMMRVGVVNTLLFGVIMLIISSGINALSIYIDMLKPNLDWKDTSELQRGNMLILLPYLVCMAIAVVVIVISCIFSATAPIFGEIGSYALFWCITAGVAIAVAVIFNLLLFKRGYRLYEKMGENKVSPKRKNESYALKSGFLK